MDAFVLGSGFSKAASDRMPVVAELAEPLTAHLASSDPGSLVDGELPIADVEGWLDYLAQRQPYLTEPEVLENRARFGRVADWLRVHLRQCERSATGSPMPGWLGQLVGLWHERRVGVVTLNYDTLVEATMWSVELHDHNGERARPWDALPVPIPGLPSRGGTAMFGGPRPETFTLVKLHGSLSWFYPGTRGYGQPIWDTREYNVWNRAEPKDPDEFLTRGLEVFIIPPTALKTPYFEHEVVTALWMEARSILRNATRIFVLGYSMPATDSVMRGLLSVFAAGKTIVPVNPDPRISDHFSRLLPAATIDASFIGHDDPILEFMSAYDDGAISV